MEVFVCFEGFANGQCPWNINVLSVVCPRGGGVKGGGREGGREGGEEGEGGRGGGGGGGGGSEFQEGSG